MQSGLLGGKLGHSYSPQIHAHLGDYPYALYERTTEEVGEFLQNTPFDGINVTIPHKKTVIPFCAELSPVAQKLGAVNTIVRRADGSLLGHNTDYFGFSRMLQTLSVDIAGKKAVVLGSGGASNTVVAVLEAAGARIQVITHRENTPENLARHSDAVLLVNASPEGMYPHNGSSPADLNLFPKLEGVLDLIYNPARTQLLLDAEARGIPAANGLEMLVAQAKESAEWFTGQPIDDDKIDFILRRLRNQMENIILIGMPGSGKTTIGTIVAEKLGKKFVDADVYLTEKVGRSIPDIFANDGEAVFRQMETEVLRELGKQSGLVIATGGGCVTREENYPLLHQNGTLFRIHRPLDNLSIEGRPLSQTMKLTEMFRFRDPLYRRFADYEVVNDGAPEAAAAEILRIWEERK